MSKKYIFAATDAKKFNKHGINLTVYEEGASTANVSHVVVKKGHFQEFLDTKSYYIYYIIQGKGTFVLNDERIEAKATDLVAIPPKTRIHYFGAMEMVLTVSPAFDEKNAQHIRFVDEKESPYQD